MPDDLQRQYDAAKRARDAAGRAYDQAKRALDRIHKDFDRDAKAIDKEMAKPDRDEHRISMMLDDLYEDLDLESTLSKDFYDAGEALRKAEKALLKAWDDLFKDSLKGKRPQPDFPSPWHSPNP